MPRKTKEQIELKNKEQKNHKKIKATPSPKNAKEVIIKTTKKSTSSSKATPKVSSRKTHPKKKLEVVEYYDLPYRYNQTVVKVLAQTPTNLFVYWDISDQDRTNLQNQFGEDFFETTRPVLIIFNDSMQKQFEVEINDFANSWYIRSR